MTWKQKRPLHSFDRKKKLGHGASFKLVLLLINLGLNARLCCSATYHGRSAIAAPAALLRSFLCLCISESWQLRQQKMRCGNANLVTSPPSVSSACLASNAVPPMHHFGRRCSKSQHCRKSHPATSRLEMTMHTGAALGASATDSELAAVSGAKANQHT